MSERLVTKRTTIAAVCKRLPEIVPFMDERDCDDFMEVSRRIHSRAEKNKERLEAATAVGNKSLKELLFVSPPHSLRGRKRDAEEDKDDEDYGEGEPIAPWDLVTHAFIKRVVSTEGDNIIVEAKRSSHGKIKCSFARVAPAQASSIDEKHWPLFAAFFMDHPMPAALANTPFGRYCTEQATFAVLQ